MRALLYALLLLLALVTLASAQATTTGKTTNNAATTTSASETTEATTTAATTDRDTTSSEESSATSASTTAAATTESSSSASSTTAAATTTAATTTGSTTGSSGSRLSNLPTLAGAGIPTVIVPDLSKAPFMQKSNYPEGTVFICVGAILGFLGMCILAWRGMLALSLRRSVKKAALAQGMSDSKTLRGPGSTYGPRGSVYNAVGHGSTMSLGDLKSPGHGGPKSPLEKTRLAPSQSSLFFSPTADNPNRVSHYSLTNRSSTYLPAGYYTAGNSTLSPTGGGFGNPRTRSMYSQNYTGPSPPDSPGLPPSSRDGPTHVPTSPLGDRSYGNSYPRAPGSRGNDSSVGGPRSSASNVGTVMGGMSTSTLNLNAPPQGRAPSAYLEDLFESGTDLPGSEPPQNPGGRTRF